MDKEHTIEFKERILEQVVDIVLKMKNNREGIGTGSTIKEDRKNILIRSIELTIPVLILKLMEMEMMEGLKPKLHFGMPEEEDMDLMEVVPNLTIKDIVSGRVIRLGRERMGITIKTIIIVERELETFILKENFAETEDLELNLVLITMVIEVEDKQLMEQSETSL